MKHRNLSCIPLLSILLLAFASAALGQTAQVSGRIADTSGAVVPGAQITLTNQANGFKRDTVTNSEGVYTIPLLQPGTYEINVRKDGFKPILQAGLVLNVEQVARLDFSLQAGAVTDTITITSSAPILERETSSVGQVVDNKTIVTLPLNGRNYSQLMLLAPGAAASPSNRASDAISLNGNRTWQNSFLIDGVDNNSYILGGDTGSVQAVRPSVDAIQEYRVETANYSAEYGRAAGGVVNVAIKSGTNQLHGSLFEFLRNDVLNANDFFANRSGLKRPPIRYNQFGGTVGGPVFRNRTFFFFSYQGTRDRQPQTVVTTVPTAEMKRGNFGGINIYDPANVVSGARVQFANNLIPDSRIDPVGRKLVALYPDPNLPGTLNNYAANVAINNDLGQYDTRVDHSFRATDTFFARYSRSRRDGYKGNLFSPPGNGANNTNELRYRLPSQANSAVIGETHIFSATTVNDIRLGYSRNDSNYSLLEEQPLFEQFGIKGVPLFDGLVGLPQISVTGYSALGSRASTPNVKQVHVFHVVDNLSLTRGSHQLRTGGDFRFTQNQAIAGQQARGTFTLNGQFTSRTPGQGLGNPIADFLLGLTSNAQLSTLLRGTFRDQYYGFYFNDSWKVSPRLTLNLGLRYEFQTPTVERNNGLYNFDLTPGSSTYGTIVQAKDGSLRTRSFLDPDRNNFAPRLGFAYQLGSKTVVRGGLGIFYGGQGWQSIGNSGAANTPNFVNISFPSGSAAATSVILLRNGFPADGLNPSRAVNPNAFGQSASDRISEIYQGNLSVQRELPGAIAVTVSYVGSGSAHLRGLNDFNAPPPGPGAIQARRPFTSFGTLTYRTDFAHSTYHSLQAKAERRFQAGFSLLSSYTWGHTIDNSTDPEDNGNPTNAQNPRDTRAEKASSILDLRQRFVTSVIYDVPFGRTGKWLSGNKALRAALGGFQLGGIFVAQTGQSFSPSVAVNPSNTTTPARPDRLSDGNLPRGERTVDRWFDIAAFRPAAQYTYGNSGRNVLYAPGLVNLDLLIARNFQFTEKKRLELRGEFFNFTNSVHFGRPNASIGNAQVGQIRSTSLSNRQVQIGLRFAF